MQKHFILNIPIYNADIIFSFGETDDQFKKSIDKYRILLAENNSNSSIWVLDSVGMHTMFTNGQSVIRLKRYPESISDMGTLQHEIFHAVVKILDYIGFTFTPDNDEPAAHLISYITEEVYKKLTIFKV